MLGITLINRMERSKGGGWIRRAQRVLGDAQNECVERVELSIHPIVDNGSHGLLLNQERQSRGHP